MEHGHDPLYDWPIEEEEEEEEEEGGGGGEGGGGEGGGENNEENIPREQEAMDETFHQAARKGNLQRVEELMGLQPIDIRDHIGLTALHYASHEGHMEVVIALLREGANINAKNGIDKCTAIGMAAKPVGTYYMSTNNNDDDESKRIQFEAKNKVLQLLRVQKCKRKVEENPLDEDDNGEEDEINRPPKRANVGREASSGSSEIIRLQDSPGIFTVNAMSDVTDMLATITTSMTKTELHNIIEKTVMKIVVDCTTTIQGQRRSLK